MYIDPLYQYSLSSSSSSPSVDHHPFCPTLQLTLSRLRRGAWGVGS